MAQALHAGYLRLQTSTGNSLFLFQDDNGCMQAPRCYVICTLPVLFKDKHLFRQLFQFVYYLSKTSRRHKHKVF